MNPQNETILDKFQARSYQYDFVKAFYDKAFHKYFICWPRKCLSGDSHILMSNGSYKLLKDVQIGDKILSFNGKKIVTDKVKNIWKTGKKKTKIIKTHNNPQIITSYDHLFASTIQNGKIIHWDKISETNKKRTLITYPGISLGRLHNPDLAEFLGYMFCDGYVSAYQQPKFTNTSIEILKRVEQLAFSLFGYKSIWRPKGNGFDLGFSNGTKGGGYTKNKIKELFRSEDQDVPNSQKKLLSFIWDFDEESLGRFFAAAISADGSIYIHKERSFYDPKRNRQVLIHPIVEITISCGRSYKLGWDFYWLLRKNGITLQTLKFDKGCNWKIRISDSKSIKNILSFGPVYGKTDKQEKALALIKNNKPISNKKIINRQFKIKEGIEEELYDIETEKNHNFYANGYLVHNSGKDICSFNMMAMAAIRKPGVYFLIYPTYSQGKKIIWDTITNDGMRFIDFIPSQLIASTHVQELKIVLTNGSILQILGSDNVDRLVGTNPQGILYSEAALQAPDAYNLMRPSLAANDGFVIFESTPRGKNWFYGLYKLAKDNPKEWFCSKLTLDDTKHIPKSEIEKDLRDGLMSEDLIQQEYFTSFDMGVEGSYYSKFLDKMRTEGRIGSVPYEAGYKVHVSFDLGVHDATSLIFFQALPGGAVHIIDCYENTDVGLAHYVKVIKEKPYLYGAFIAPHDIKVRELGSGMSRYETAANLGLHFKIAPNLSLEDGIEACKAALSSKVWIDIKCTKLINALENYRREYDPKQQVYKNYPLHNFASHFCDSFRYLCISLSKTADGLTPEQLEKNYREAIYGDSYRLPKAFREDDW